MNSLQAYIILCDLGGTFVDVDQITYAKDELGIGPLFAYGLTNFLNFNPQKRIFQTLEKIGGTQSVITHENRDNAVPKIYCDWMAGAYEDHQALREYILQEIDKLYQESFFSSYLEYCIVYNAINAMFCPEKLVQHQYLIKPMVALLERIDPAEHTLVAVTNWDPHSYPLFLESPVGQKIAQHIKKEHMIVSGYIKYNKPHEGFYQHIFDTYGHDNKQKYLFIDNDITNIKAAQELGIPSIHFTGDVSAIEQALIDRGIIYEKRV
jgi:FMN phosphatase YigB (HAD superfamily)